MKEELLAALELLWATREYQWSNSGGDYYALNFYGNPDDISNLIKKAKEKAA